MLSYRYSSPKSGFNERSGLGRRNGGVRCWTSELTWHGGVEVRAAAYRLHNGSGSVYVDAYFIQISRDGILLL